MLFKLAKRAGLTWLKTLKKLYFLHCSRVAAIGLAPVPAPNLLNITYFEAGDICQKAAIGWYLSHLYSNRVKMPNSCSLTEYQLTPMAFTKRM